MPTVPSIIKVAPAGRLYTAPAVLVVPSIHTNAYIACRDIRTTTVVIEPSRMNVYNVGI